MSNSHSEGFFHFAPISNVCLTKLFQMWICANLIIQKYLSIVLICIFLIIGEVKDLSMCSVAFVCLYINCPCLSPHVLLGIWTSLFQDLSFTVLGSFLLEQSSGSQLGMILPLAWLPSLRQLAMSRRIFECHT